MSKEIEELKEVLERGTKARITLSPKDKEVLFKALDALERKGSQLNREEIEQEAEKRYRKYILDISGIEINDDVDFIGGDSIAIEFAVNFHLHMMQKQNLSDMMADDEKDGIYEGLSRETPKQIK